MASRVHGRSWRVAAIAAVVSFAAAPAFAQLAAPRSVPPPGLPANAQIEALKDVRIDQKLDAAVPLDLAFVDEAGKDVTLRDYFGKRPVVLALVYYECPMLCTLVLNGLVSSLETMSLDAGKDFDLVAVSFDPGETPALALDKKKMYVQRYHRAGTEAGFHFLTGREASIKQLADAVGFRYTYDPVTDQFAHPAAVTVLTPAGRVSRYLYGVEPAPVDLRLALVESGDGKIGTFLDQALLYCFHYDPLVGKYGFAILSLIRLGGLLTLGAVAISIIRTVRRDRRRGHAVAATVTGHV